MKFSGLVFFGALAAFSFCCSIALAQDDFEVIPVPEIELGDEYENYAKPRGGEFTAQSSSAERSLLERSFFYIPNRILDFIDIFRVDLGVGPAVGAVARITSSGQFGYRKLAPGSLRFGLEGRNPPIFVETHSEGGIGPYFEQSLDREVSPLEMGAGVDILIAGAYAGVCLDEAFDFIGGFVGIDFKDDDL